MWEVGGYCDGGGGGCGYGWSAVRGGGYEAGGY